MAKDSVEIEVDKVANRVRKVLENEPDFTGAFEFNFFKGEVRDVVIRHRQKIKVSER
jgi:hypothetical protein